MLSNTHRLPEDEFVDDLFFLLSIALGQCIFVSVDMYYDSGRNASIFICISVRVLYLSVTSALCARSTGGHAMCRVRAQPEAGLVAPRYLPSTTREVQAVKVYNSRSQGTQVLSDSGVAGCIVGVVLVVTGVHPAGWG